MYEINPQDLIITTYSVTLNGGFIHRPESGIKIYHKPTQLEVAIDKHRSQHRNTGLCIKILQDLLTDFTEGDIVVTRKGVGEITDFDHDSVTCKLEDGRGFTDFDDRVFHT